MSGLERDLLTPALAKLRRTERRSITAENPTGQLGAGARATEGTGARAARDLGLGWKVSPSRVLEPGAILELARIEGEGVVDHLWLTTRSASWRRLILRMRWDEAQGEPAIAVPLGDFFCQGWARYAPVSSSLIVVAPYGGFTSYFPMPFRTGAHITLENLGEEAVPVYYQIDYSLGAVDPSVGYLHASWRRSNPVPEREVHTIVDGVEGWGRYIGTYLAVGVNGPGWWGEGEVKFFVDGDGDFPTLCGTGTEDYFGGAWNFEVPGFGYQTFSSPSLGMHQVIRPDGLYDSQMRFGMYRWHIADPIDFSERLRVTIQDLGWRPDGRYWPRSDDLASVAYWYSDRPAGVIGDPLESDHLEVGSRP